jgi:hypothetical protein
MITIANMMIDMSSIKKGKHGIWRVEVKTLEEVQGILINKQRESSNVVQKKDETLLRRKAFNIKVLRPRFMQENQSSASFVDAADLQGKLILRENENEETRAETRQENYVRML